MGQYDNPRRDFIHYARETQYEEERQFLLDCAKHARGSSIVSVGRRLPGTCYKPNHITGYIGVMQFKRHGGVIYFWSIMMQGAKYKGHASTARDAAIDRDRVGRQIGLERNRLNFPGGIPEPTNP